MTFYTSLYLPNESWQSQKTAYDPCPVGWHVPDGDEEGVWAKAFGSSDFQASFDGKNKGFNFSGKLGDSETIWYAASGFREYKSGVLDKVGSEGYYWSYSPNFSKGARGLYFFDGGIVYPAYYFSRSAGRPIRCLKEK